MTRLTPLFALMLAVALPAQAGKIYKWVDDNGRTHYSQTPPPAKAKKSKPMDVRTQRSSTPYIPASAKAATDVNSKDGQLSIKDVKKVDDKRVKELESKLKAQQAEKRKQSCAALKRSVDNLAVGGRVYEMQNGKRKYLSGAEMDAKLAQARQTYSNECS